MALHGTVCSLLFTDKSWMISGRKCTFKTTKNVSTLKTKGGNLKPMGSILGHESIMCFDSFRPSLFYLTLLRGVCVSIRSTSVLFHACWYHAVLSPTKF